MKNKRLLAELLREAKERKEPYGKVYLPQPDRDPRKMCQCHKCKKARGEG